MKSLSQPGATHFVGSFAQSPSSSQVSVGKYLSLNYPTAKTFVEGQPGFHELKDCLLRDADRFAFLASSNYARTLDMMRGSSSAWCIVGFYYAAFFAAKAILGLQGCWMQSQSRWIEATASNPGHQTLKYNKQKYPTPVSGSHRVFWVAYYSAVAPLQAWMPPEALLGVKPISANTAWFIELRNKVNYDPVAAFGIIDDFLLRYDGGKLPACLPGDLRSAHTVAGAVLSALKEMATQCGVATDVFKPRRSRATAIRALVTGPRPSDLRSFARQEVGGVVF